MYKIICLILVSTLTLNSAYSTGSQQSNNVLNINYPKTSASNNGNYKTTTSTFDKESRILRNDNKVNDDGSYYYDFETSNGIKRTEQGAPDGIIQGSSSYVSPEGIEIKTTYIADETGYHPVGDHIPKIPDYILRALEYIRNNPYFERDYYTGEVREASFKSKRKHNSRNKRNKKNYFKN